MSYLLLKTIYGDQLDEQLLITMKVNLYGDDTNLKDIKNVALDDLTSNEMKKLMVEFMFELCFSDFTLLL